MRVDHDALGHTAHAGGDAAIVGRRARVDRDQIGGPGIADRLNALTQQGFEQFTAGEGRAAIDEAVSRRAPVSAQPSAVGLGAAAAGDDRAWRRRVRRPIQTGGRGGQASILDHGIADLAAVADLDSQLLGERIEPVEQRLAAAEQKGRAARFGQNAAGDRLQGHAGLDQPILDLRRALDEQTSQHRIGRPLSRAREFGPELIGRIDPGRKGRGRLMTEAQIARMPGIAAAQRFGRLLGQQHRATRAPCRDGRAQGRRTAADHQDVWVEAGDRRWRKPPPWTEMHEEV